MDTLGDRNDRELMEIYEEAERRAVELEGKAELFDWLMSQMRCSSPHMNNTFHWNLPLRVLSSYMARTPQEAVQAAFKKHMERKAEYEQNAQKPLPGAQE